MTNTQKVTELQPRMTREQLIDAARNAAKYLPVASAQLMNELANRLDYTSVALCEAMSQRKSLAAELHAVEAIHNDAVFITDEHYEQCPEEVQKIIRSLAVMQIPAYQVFLAEVRAHDLNAFIQHHSAELDAHIKNGGEQFDEKSVRIRDIIVSARLFREQLRKGVQS